MATYRAFDDKGNKFVITITSVQYFKGVNTRDLVLSLLPGNGRQKHKTRKNLVNKSLDTIPHHHHNQQWSLGSDKI